MIKDYLDYISIKRDELGGHAICPFAKSFLNKIKIIESKNFLKDAFQCMQNEVHPTLYLIYGSSKQFDKKWLDEFCEDHQEFARTKDLWLIWDHPDQINKITQGNEKKYFRITVQGGGCSGFKYNFRFDKETRNDDIIFNNAVIDKTSLDIISGSVVDFKKEMIGESFVISNPKASSSCGCGLSFSV